MKKFKLHIKWKDPKFKENQPIFFDTETYRDPTLKSKAKTLVFYGNTRLVQMCQGGKVHMYDIMAGGQKMLDELYKYTKGKHFVAQYAIYDFFCPMTKAPLTKPGLVEDTIYMARHAYPELEAFDLGALFKHVGLEPKGEEGTSDWGVPELTEDQLYYAAYDVYGLEKLYHMKMMAKARKMPTYIIDTKALNYSLNFAFNGFKVCQTSLESFKKQKIDAISEVVKTLPESLNVNSSKQVCEYLGTDAANVGVLTELYLDQHNEDAGNILKLRKLMKQLSTLEKKWSFDRVYAKFNMSGAISGRATASGLNPDPKFANWTNLQQLDRTMKPVFGYEEDNDLYLVDCDFQSLEIFGMVATYNEPIIAQMILDGQDVHTEVSKLVDLPGKDAKFKRQVAKGMNFSIGYGGGVETVQTFIQNYAQELLPYHIVEMLRTKWLEKFVNIKKYHKVIAGRFRNKPPFIMVADIMGRPMRAEGYNKAINTPVQALGSDQNKIAIDYTYQAYPDAKITNTVHDSITLEVRGLEKAKRVAWIVKEAMDKSWIDILPYASEAAQPLVMNNVAEITKLYGGEVLWSTENRKPETGLTIPSKNKGE